MAPRRRCVIEPAQARALPRKRTFRVKLCSRHVVPIADRSSSGVSASAMPSRKLCTGSSYPTAASFAAGTSFCFAGKLLSKERSEASVLRLRQNSELAVDGPDHAADLGQLPVEP